MNAAKRDQEGDVKRQTLVPVLFGRALLGAAVCASLLASSAVTAAAFDTLAPTATAMNWEPTSFAGASNRNYDDRFRLVGDARDTTNDASVVPSIKALNVAFRRKTCPICLWEYLRSDGTWTPSYTNVSQSPPQFDTGVSGSGLSAVHSYRWYFDLPTRLPSTSGRYVIAYFVNIRPQDASGNTNVGPGALSMRVSPVDFSNPESDLTPPASSISSPLNLGRWSPPFAILGTVLDTGSATYFGSVAFVKISIRRTSDNLFMQADGSFAAIYFEFKRAETATGPWFSGYTTDQITRAATVNFSWAPPVAPGKNSYAIKLKATDAAGNVELSWVERSVTV